MVERSGDIGVDYVGNVSVSVGVTGAVIFAGCGGFCLESYDFCDLTAFGDTEGVYFLV